MPLSKPRILVIEDDPSISTYFRHTLWHDFRVEIADTIAEAMCRIADTSIPIQCIVFDLHIPDGSGPTIIKKFREMFPDVPVVVIARMEDSIIDAVGAGAAEIIHKKDASPTLLIESIDRAINFRRQSG